MMSIGDSKFLGLDVGGTKCAAVVGTERGQILERREWASEVHRGPAVMINELCRAAFELIGAYPDMAAAGVSIGGPLDADRGVILSPPNLPGWDAIPLRTILRERLKIPVGLEHDAAACCLAEYRWGAGQGATRLIYLTCGTGFGAGIVIDGRIYRGAGGASPEIGHARFREDGPTAFGKTGSVEAYCAGASIGKLAAWKFPERWPEPPTTEQIAALAQSGDSEALQVLHINASAAGEVCANLADLLRPEKILLGSLSSHLGDSWVQRVREQFLAEALESTSRACSIEPAGLGARLQDYSALVVAVSLLNEAET
jgi:glucokinase